MNHFLHLSTYLQGGAGRIICDLIEHQSALGHDVTCIVNETESPGYHNYPHFEDRVRKVARLIHVNGLFKREVSSLVNVARFLAETPGIERTALIHAHASYPALAALLLRGMLSTNIPVIQTMHGWGTNKTSDQETMDIAVMNQLDHVVAVSKCSKSLLIGKGLSPDKISVICNGVGITQPPVRHEWNQLQAIKKTCNYLNWLYRNLV